jgi:hypothetical protein
MISEKQQRKDVESPNAALLAQTVFIANGSAPKEC